MVGHVLCWGSTIQYEVLSPPKQYTIMNVDGTLETKTLNSYQHSKITAGYEEGEDVPVVKEVRDLEFKQISVGFEYACGILYRSGNLQCWGHKGSHNKLNRHEVVGPFKQVSVGATGVCALQEDDTMRCFGRRINDDLADMNPYRKWDQISVGGKGFCAVDIYSSVECFGLFTVPRFDIVVA
jgi:hypothetical protein